ncbi:MAG: hypothetical protein N5P05_000957 [Chroococcopsis gigantea SAG 12.99]|jgi:hypothetical protein|nr:DUF928 domain-containing protein [Chlorogloea purpurea SAG 13.99]MDV2999351.1 hypothetical protein [Chroococcopsis gigantea SAG 12.99]
MIRKQYFHGLICLGLILTPITWAAAQEITQVSFKPPADEGVPNRTKGLGSRGGKCPLDGADQSQMKALVPASNVGLTISSNPTFWVYLPKTYAKRMVLSIMEIQDNGAEKHLSQNFLTVPEASGVIGLTPNPDTPPLEVGKTYKWAVTLICGEKQNITRDPRAVAIVHRVVAPSLNGPEEALGRAVWYGDRGIWYDALSSLAQARREQPHNSALTKTWTDFLDSAGLEGSATKDLIF